MPRILIISALIFIELFAAGRATQTQTHKNSGLTGIRHVLLISIDGFHAVNLANYVQSHPRSALRRLSATGITYTNASCSRPSDSVPGFLAQITGGSPRSTGIWYEVSYRRDLSPPRSNCEILGTVVFIDDEIDKDPKSLDGGGIDPQKLPRDPSQGCTPVYPHSLLRVNTVFEIAREHGLRTAWVDKHLAYEFARGPSSQGISDLYTPEIAAINPQNGNDWAATLDDVEIYDASKVQAITHQIDGYDHTGTASVGVPAIFGMNFQALHIAQKHAGDPKFGKGGYLDVNATPGPFVAAALDFVDMEIGKLVSELERRDLLNSTLIIISAKHGESPLDVSRRRIIDMTLPAQIIGPNDAYDQSDDGSVIWLKDQHETAKIVERLNSPVNQKLLGIQEIFAGNLLKESFGDPETDPRVPDIILKTETGVMFHKITNAKLAENGGINEDDLHVGLLVSNPTLAQESIVTPVQTTQIAPSILAVLGLNGSDLKAVRIEHTPELPDLASKF